MSDPQGSESTTPPISEETSAAGSGGDLATGGDDDDTAGVHDGAPLTREAALQRDDPDDDLPARGADDVTASQESGPS